MKRILVVLLALAGLLLVLPTSSLLVSSATAATADRWATVTAPDQVLRKGCRDYRFSYRIDVPGDEWMVELFLVGPRGSRLGTKTYESAAQRSAETRSWRICRPTTLPGVHQIKVKVTSYDGREVTERWTTPTRFRLRTR